MPTFKLYDTLGVPQNASKDDIKKAYRILAKEHHPDKGGDPEKFKEIAQAYEILSNDEKRNRYDHIGDALLTDMNAGQGGGHGGGFSHMDAQNIFEQFFGGGGGMFHHHPFGMPTRGPPTPPGPIRRQEHRHTLHITLQEAYHGVTKTIKVTLRKTCTSCKREVCGQCQGQGTITDMRRMGFLTQMMTRACDACGATGRILRARVDCSVCSGQGTFQEERREELQIPPGVHSGNHIRLGGMGEQPKNDGEIAGDLVVIVTVKDDPNFQRSGNDLVYRIPLDFAESIVGKQITIPHFKEPISFDTSIFGVIQHEKPYAVERLGMPIDSGKKNYGHLILIFQIKYPTTPWKDTEKQLLIECFQKLGIYT